ncbi:Non-canonical non-ribosomal peptide synthetase FUB8 [Hypsizygus marmoreus]|uniref:Non-canonical non-ribosomal peptide synthetase FUB8 n=1 Tax=Hypsizygus marmoreus TaxID=39966 RepID=A0A369JHQ9_HYPMA|nr:Non-canonical non-ribosomal peptide synthetase FUB8 [Hypsizygus marmoreus]
MSRDHPVLPLGDSRALTVAETLDFHLEHNAEYPFYVFSPAEGEQNTIITHLEFARASHRAAHLVRPRQEGNSGRVVGVIALVDAMTYQATIAGLIKAGLIPFPISPRLSPPAVFHLLQKTSCTRILTTPETLRGLLDGLKNEVLQNAPDFPLFIQEIPSLHQLYPKLGSEKVEDPFEPYSSPVDRSSMTDIALFLHSSGSTGLPKAIPETHRTLVEWAAAGFHILSAYRPHIRFSGLALPSFHTLGIFAQLLHPLFAVLSVSLYPPSVFGRKDQPIVPTPENILDHLRRTETTALIIIPAILHTWSQSEEAINFLKTLVYVGYSGGPVAEKLGNSLAASGVNLRAVYGGTEFGAPTLPRFSRDDQDWEWMEFSPKVNIRWVDEGDGRYECQFLTCETHHPAVENMDDPQGYATSDLFERHPTKPNLWRIVGRKDDVIIHSSGEKTVPGPMEEIISSSPIVKGIVMFGRKHDQTGVLIEPTPPHAIDPDEHDQLAALRNKLWPIIEEANRDAPAFSRIFKEMILIASLDKPLPRSAKGTVQKKEAVKMYADEIEALYEVVESTKGGDAVVPPGKWDENTVKEWLLEQVRDIHPGKDISPSIDLFEQGFDSLSATFLRLRLSGALRSTKELARAADAVLQNTVYTYPTVNALTSFIVGLVADPQSAGKTKDQRQVIEDMIAKYTLGLEEPMSGLRMMNGHSTDVGSAVLITGTTGNLGAQLLTNLLENETVERIYALNRPPTGSQSIVDRHKIRFEDKGLDPSLLESSKLVFIEGDSAEVNLGLDETVYDEIRSSVTLIIHTAWKLDFNLTLPSFEPNVRGTRRLVDLARSSPHASTVRLLFTSSISSAQSWDQTKGPYPEEVVEDVGYAVGGGYGEGKYVAERILAKSGLHACSLRIGQVSGGLPNGAWAASDWVPILVKSSLGLGALPSNNGVVSWVPMDAVCRAMLDIAFSKETPPLALNLVHPLPVAWNAVIKAIGKALCEMRHDAGGIPLIPIEKWASRLEERAKFANDDDYKTIPAIKLLDFFRGMRAGKDYEESGGLASFDTEKARMVSKTMRELHPIGVADARRWVEYWNAKNFFG